MCMSCDSAALILYAHLRCERECVSVSVVREGR